MDDKEHPIRNAAILGLSVGILVYAFEWVRAPYAEPDYQGSNLTKEEQKTVDLAYDFNDCVKAKLSTVTQIDVDFYNATKNGTATKADFQNHFDDWAEGECVSELNIDKPALDIKMDAIYEKTGRKLSL